MSAEKDRRGKSPRQLVLDQPHFTLVDRHFTCPDLALGLFFLQIYEDLSAKFSFFFCVFGNSNYFPFHDCVKNILNVLTLLTLDHQINPLKVVD